MSSIYVDDLKYLLYKYPDDAEVIFEITEYDPNAENKKKKSIAYINGIRYDKNHNEVILMN